MTGEMRQALLQRILVGADKLTDKGLSHFFVPMRHLNTRDIVSILTTTCCVNEIPEKEQLWFH